MKLITQSFVRTMTTLCLLLILGIAPASAQVLYGTITGVVEDSSGAVVPNAEITATNKETGLARVAKSDGSGTYTIGNLQPGPYDVKVTASGFKTVSRLDLSVLSNNVIRVDLRMEVGNVSETITVEANATQLQTDRADVKSEISQKAVEALPMNIFRNYQAIINLVPGATPAAFQNSATDSPGRSLRTFVNGTPPNMNTTRVDGAVSVNIWLPHHAGYVAPSETVEQVNVGTGSLDAEQGMAGGAAVNVISRGGTNDFRAAGWWYFSNQDLQAKPYFLGNGDPRVVSGQLKARDLMPDQSVNIPGVRAGGAIIKNKLFYFGHYEFYRQRTGGILTNASLPAADLRGGNFSRVSTILYDPASNANPALRTPFAGNIIPTSRISPVAQRVFGLLPNPTKTGTGDLLNFDATGTGVFDRWNYDFKGNYNVTEKLSTFFKYSRMKALVTGQPAFGEMIGPGVGGDPGTGDTVVHVPSVGGTYVFSPNFLVDAVWGVNWQDQTVQGIDFGTNWGSDVLRIPGTNGSDIRQSGMPVFAISQYTGLGLTNNWMPLFRNDRSYTFSTNATWNKGRHELRFGYDAVYHQLNHWQPEQNQGPRGGFTFSGQMTGLQGGAAVNQYNSLADFMLGIYTGATKSYQVELMTGREWQHGFYVRDRWQLTRNITLNLGLRFEYYPLMTRANTGLERLELATQNIILGGRGNQPTDAGININSLFLAPRIGIAWRLNDKTVIRTGYGLNPDPLPFSRPLRGFYPLVFGQSIAQPAAFEAAGTLAQGIPNVTFPNTSSGIIPLPNTVDMRTPAQDLDRGYIQSWNFTVERRLPLEVVASVAYVGTQSTNMLGDLNVNAAAPGADVAGMPYNIAFGRRIALNYWDGWLSSNYHSLQLAFNRNFKNGLYIKGAYTYSRAMNRTDENGWAGVNFNWVPWLDRNYAQAGYNRPHNWQTAVVYELPFGKGKPFASGGFLGAVLGGWQVNAQMYRFSGSPFTVSGDGSQLLAPGNIQTAVQVKDNVARLNQVGPGQPYFDPSAFADPVTFARANGINPRGYFGNTGRNLLRGPHVIGMDGGILRNFTLFKAGDRPINATFRFEGFNLTNTGRFVNPAAGANVPATFMTITSTTAANAPAQERQLRFGLRIEY